MLICSCSHARAHVRTRAHAHGYAHADPLKLSYHAVVILYKSLYLGPSIHRRELFSFYAGSFVIIAPIKSSRSLLNHCSCPPTQHDATPAHAA